MDPEIIISHVANSSLAGQEQHFKKDRVTIGRDGGNDVEFDPDEDLYVSHRHAEVYAENDGLWVRDLDSRNGTYVNHRRISAPTEIAPDDTIHFGANGPLAKARLAGAEVRRGQPTQAIPAGVGIRETMEGQAMHAPDLSDEAPPPKAARGKRRAPPTPQQRFEESLQVAPPLPRPGAPAPAPDFAQSWVQPAAPQRKPSMFRSLAVIVFCVGLGAAGLYGYNTYVAEQAAKSNSAAPAEIPRSKYVAALGRLEPEGGVLSICGPAGQTLKKLLVDEGQTVKADDPLAYLSGYDAAQVEFESARAALVEATAQAESTKSYAAALVEEARAAVRQTEKPLDLEVAATQATVDLLRSNLNIAIEDRRQLEQMGQNATSQQLSRQKMVEQGAQRDLTAAEKKLDTLRGSLEPRRAQTRAALNTAIANQARLEQSVSTKVAEKNVERAKAQLEQTIVRAPRDGKILKILAREGAAMGGQPILQMGDTRKLYVVAELYETDVRNVAQKQKAIVKSQALPEDLHGEVDKVLWMVERNGVRQIDPTAPEDLRIVEARILLDDRDVAKHQALLEKLINLQVSVQINRD